jgi:dihydropteroate synthase
VSEKQSAEDSVVGLISGRPKHPLSKQPSFEALPGTAIDASHDWVNADSPKFDDIQMNGIVIILPPRNRLPEKYLHKITLLKPLSHFHELGMTRNCWRYNGTPCTK